MVKEKITFDFEVPYKIYPRKEGKKRAFIKLKTIIKTQEDYDSFVVSLNNYVDMCNRECRELRYIKQFCTFVNNYEDYLEKQEESNPVSKNISQLERIMKGTL